MSNPKRVEAVTAAMRELMGPLFGSPEYLADPVKRARAEKRQADAARAQAHAAINALTALGADWPDDEAVERLAEALFNSGASSIGFQGDARMENCRIHARAALLEAAAPPRREVTEEEVGIAVRAYNNADGHHYGCDRAAMRAALEAFLANRGGVKP